MFYQQISLSALFLCHKTLLFTPSHWKSGYVGVLLVGINFANMFRNYLIFYSNILHHFTTLQMISRSANQPFYGMCSMVKEFWNICKFCTWLWDHSIIDTKKNGLCFEAVRNQAQSNPGGCIHEPRVIRFCISTGKIKRIERFSGNSGEKMPVQETDGMYRFQSQYGKHQQKQGICGWRGKSFKISRKILIKSTNQCLFVV